MSINSLKLSAKFCFAPRVSFGTFWSPIPGIQWIFRSLSVPPGVPWNYLAVRGWKLGPISTYLALLGFFGLQSAQNSLIALKKAPLGPPNSKIGCYFKIGQFLAEIWPIYRDRKTRIFKRQIPSRNGSWFSALNSLLPPYHRRKCY